MAETMVEPMAMSMVVPPTSAPITQAKAEPNRRACVNPSRMHRCRRCISRGNGIGLAVDRTGGIDVVWLLIR